MRIESITLTGNQRTITLTSDRETITLVGERKSISIFADEEPMFRFAMMIQAYADGYSGSNSEIRTYRDLLDRF